MQANAYLAFVGVSIAILVFPGPSTLLIAANSLRRGRTVGLYTVVGGIGAMVVQLAVALAGLTSLASVSGARFDYVRGLGCRLPRVPRPAALAGLVRREPRTWYGGYVPFGHCSRVLWWR